MPVTCPDPARNIAETECTAQAEAMPTPHVAVRMPHGALCPACGEHTLRRECGCSACICGYSVCG